MDKLRAIVLMEVDFNMANRILVNYRMLRQAESQGMILEHQSGGRNGRSAQESGLETILTMEASCLNYRAMALVS